MPEITSVMIAWTGPRFALHTFEHIKTDLPFAARKVCGKLIEGIDPAEYVNHSARTGALMV